MAKRDGKIGGVSVGEVVGQLFNAPNTAAGLAYGSVGHTLGVMAHAVDRRVPQPRISTRGGRTEFFNNPLAYQGAITLGEVTAYGDDPYSPAGRRTWRNKEVSEGHPVWEHERQHVLQGRQLGPAYLPSNALGGLTASIFDRDWHGPRNWSERGPQMQPARPWPRSRPRSGAR